MLQWMSHNKTRFKKTAAVLSVIFVAVFCYSFFVFGDAVSAQSIADPGSELNQGVEIIEQPLGLPATDIRKIIANIIRAALGLLGIVLVGYIIYGGYLWMTAGGNEEQLGQAKKVLKNAVIGLAIILSAYAIVLFVMRLLGIDTSFTGGGQTIAPPGTQNYRGSGALGRVVKDHYPVRDQINVPRNSKIVITFFKPIQVNGDFVEEVSGDTTFGNCASNFSGWAVSCDRLKLDNDFINITRADGETIAGAAILAATSTVKNVTGVYTIVIKPFTDLSDIDGGVLGSDTENIGYVVHLGPDLRLDDPDNGNPAAFSAGSRFYEWRFTCSTLFDRNPPYVVSVFPGDGTASPRNTVIQIDFSEPIDPTGVQGSFSNVADEDYFTLPGNNLFLRTGDKPAGSFNLVNGYRTLEFSPSTPCGRNACGRPIFCIPTGDYDLLLKAARAIASSSFEALPFSGVMDLSGNALDGDHDNIVDFATTTGPVFNDWKYPDNRWWNFRVNDSIDATAPHILQIRPGIDSQYVAPTNTWQMIFSKRLRVDSVYSIGIDEKPLPAERCRILAGRGVVTDCVPDLIWKLPSVHFSSGETYSPTTVDMSHGPFLWGLRQFYYPTVPSDVEDVNGNCFYPGLGPGHGETELTIPVVETQICDTHNGSGCSPAHTPPPAGEDFTCNGAVNDTATTSASCLERLKELSNPE